MGKERKYRQPNGAHQKFYRFCFPRPGWIGKVINFANILRSAFSNKSVLKSFSLPRIWLCIYLSKEYWQKSCSQKLANLIKGVNFTDIFTSSFFMQSFVRQLLIKIFNFSDSESNLDTAGVTLETSLRCESAPVMPSSRQYSTGTGNRRLKSRQKSQDLPLFHCPQVTTRQYKCPSIFIESNTFQGRISWIVFCIEVFSSIVTQTSL